jgi:hypothetical protein
MAVRYGPIAMVKVRALLFILPSLQKRLYILEASCKKQEFK